MLWWDFKRAVQKQMTVKLNELKYSSVKKNEWPKIPPPLCERLIKLDRKLLMRVIAAK